MITLTKLWMAHKSNFKWLRQPRSSRSITHKYFIVINEKTVQKQGEFLSTVRPEETAQRAYLKDTVDVKSL